MAESEEQIPPHAEDDDDVLTPGYQAPAKKTLEEIKKADAEDESLKKYKQALLGQAADSANLVFFPNNPLNVIVTKLSFVAADRTDKELDLTGNLDELKKQVFTIKEGVSYRIKITFHVQREIVSGLRYIQGVYRKGIKVEKQNHMVGSYAPRKEAHEFLTPFDEAPSGLLARGTYTVKSCFTDDDKNKYLEWEWKFEIKKDWD
ncbi:hypothetical protein CHS0354_041777 [Potamilus streckersoni]|uniref:Rho GDP-dissociation inhibitor 3 n=1 Tax=Potamilus streckersoni TaxID=2493646 RepID=A0AAE0T1A4_9BIVA|nr:hypothetical protein CHS0354_041777 [Potamilus streckersoni]